MPVSGFQGRGLVNSFLGGDGPTGTLTSPPLRVERKYLQFLLGGGNHPQETCINLLHEGNVVRTATFDSGEGSEHLEPRAWDVSELAGKTVRIEIVDRASGGWGHVNVDQIVQTDQHLPGWQLNPARSLTVSQRYLHLPIKNGAAKRKSRIVVAGKAMRQFDVELADRQPDWWAFVDVSAWRDQSISIEVDRLPEGSQALSQMTAADRPTAASEADYREPLRPQFHFSALRGWLNDPNGLVYFDGEYHLFFQHNPYGWNWGNMHWGHAVSTDLVHWRQLPIALYPDELGTMFSGSAVVDWHNTAGLQTGRQPALVCIYTAAGNPFTQCLAYSNDRGRTWNKYAGNPVLKQLAPGNRDPKVLWHEPTGKWLMALYLDRNDFALFNSPDLKHWTELSRLTIPDTIECPEFFPIALEGEGGQSRWIFYGANGHYLVGSFDGRKFTPQTGPQPLHHGNCFYASQTYTDIAPQDGRRILIPWGQVALPGMPFNQMMGLPVELTLRAHGDQPRLMVQPVRELESLRGQGRQFAAMALQPGDNPLHGIDADLVEVVADIDPGQAEQIRFSLRGVEVVCDIRAGTVRCLDKEASLPIVDGRIQLRMLLDRASLDLFGAGGATYMPMGVIAAAENRALALTASGGAATIRQLVIYPLRSAWTEKSGL